MAHTITAESWPHLCEVLFEDSWQPGLGRFRSHYAYKGLGDASYDLTTTLIRLNARHPDVERHLLRNFKKYALLEAKVSGEFWNWLALGQHHGLPTRLLDWTYSPFVALHFATADLTAPETDSVVWCVDYVKAHEMLPPRLQKVLCEEGSDVWTTEMLEEHVGSWEELNSLKTSRRKSKAPADEGDAVLIFFEPPSLDSRIVNQYGLFSVLSSPTLAVDEWLKQHKDLAKRIVIPHGLRWEVRDKLDQANVNERVLFPGLDGLSSWLRRHYAPPNLANTRAVEPENTPMN